jgi:hypothetical protein
VIISSLMDDTPDCHGRGPEFNPRRVYSYIFAVTWYTIFLQQPEIIKMPNSKLDMEMYPQFLCEN